MIAENDRLSISEHLDHFKIEWKEDGLVINLSYTRKGKIFDSNKEMRLLFETQTDLDTFTDILWKLISTEGQESNSSVTL